MRTILYLFGTAFLPFLILSSVQAQQKCAGWMNHSLQKLHSDQTVSLCEATTGRPLLLVNSASHCGFTSQFSGLKALS
jgi:glutathione peroxidase